MLTTHRMVRLGIVCFVMSLASLAAARPAARPALHWSRGEGAGSCIDPRALSLRVTALTGSVLVEPTSADISIEGHVKALGDGGFEVHVSSTTISGTRRGDRTLRHLGNDCHALDEAITFVIALLIDPDLALEKLPAPLVELGVEGATGDELLRRELEARPPRPVAPAAPTAAAAPSMIKPARVSPQAPEPAVQFAVQGAMVVSGHDLPHVAFGALLSGDALFRGWLAVELQLRVAAMVGSLQLDGVRSVSAQNLAGALLVCPRVPLFARVVGEGCLGPELFFVLAQGEGFSDSRASHVSGVAAHLAAGLKIDLYPRWALRARGFVRLSPDTKRFVYAGLDGKHEALVSERVAAGGALGVSYTF